jgi:small subunit ribosomal protein S16
VLIKSNASKEYTYEVKMVKLRLRKSGANDKPFYRVVAVDSRRKRDGQYLDNIGYYDPKMDPFKLQLDTDKAIYWLSQGAQPTETVNSLLRRAGILEKWHTMRFAKKAEPTE